MSWLICVLSKLYVGKLTVARVLSDPFLIISYNRSMFRQCQINISYTNCLVSDWINYSINQDRTKQKKQHKFCLELKRFDPFHSDDFPCMLIEYGSQRLQSEQAYRFVLSYQSNSPI